eukprot:11181684-Lingulodinium_polyedra.AAC.1
MPRRTFGVLAAFSDASVRACCWLPKSPILATFLAPGAGERSFCVCASAVSRAVRFRRMSGA